MWFAFFFDQLTLFDFDACKVVFATQLAQIHTLGYVGSFASDPFEHIDGIVGHPAAGICFFVAAHGSGVVMVTKSQAGQCSTVMSWPVWFGQSKVVVCLCGHASCTVWVCISLRCLYRPLLGRPG